MVNLRSTIEDTMSYPEKKKRELTEKEKEEIRKRIEQSQDDNESLAKEFDCSRSQITGIKAWMKRTS